MMTQSLTIEIRTGGVALVTLDVPGEKVNVLSSRFFDEFGHLLSRVEEDDAIRAVVLCSGKSGSFVAGADLDEVIAFRNVAEASRFVRKAEAQVTTSTRGLYPAPRAILDAVRTGLQQGVAAGQQREITLFGSLVMTPETRHLIWLFKSMTEMKKPPVTAEPREIHKLGILGAGLMGTGIAAVSLPLCPVVLKDVSQETLDRATTTLTSGVERRLASGAITAKDAAEQKNRLETSNDSSSIAGCGLVIEAVFESLDLKRTVVEESESVIAPDAVFASNTSALPIREIAAAARHPERIVGMHYFSPVT
ncbi:MAG TPA: 3-hydroxyacyl-CoA dehydrogenase NAD-binding domain-containing protein, partial [Thermoanaerobaculia bacterium]|nr:3-hydroxyacyl-CoA dehydrogenase NAD-binding domain-containing protein [Thermoanaerobaculia bacterium]